MALISKPNTFSAGTTIIASEHNANFDTVYNDYNGNITDANIASGAAIDDAKLAQITAANKVSTSSITDDDVDLADVTCDAVLLDEGSATTTGASQGALYTKDSGGATELFYREESNGTEVQITDGGGLSSGAVVQSLYADVNIMVTCATAFPVNNTTPQNNEGDEVITLAVTPTSATNDLLITVSICGGSSTANGGGIGLFQDTTANAIAATILDTGGSDGAGNAVLRYRMTSGTTSSTTFKVRAGVRTGTFYANGDAAGVQVFNGLSVTSITIEEIIP